MRNFRGGGICVARLLLKGGSTRSFAPLKNLFVYQQVQQEVGLGEDFDARILAQVETPVVKAKRLTLTGRFIPLFKAAAVIAIIFH